MTDEAPDHGAKRGHRGSDPTKMVNQPALQTSSGAIWMVMGGLLTVISLVPLTALALGPSRPSAPIAITTGIVLLLLYAALITVGSGGRPGPRRLRTMAVLMVASAGVAVLGLALSAHAENTAASQNEQSELAGVTSGGSQADARTPATLVTSIATRQSPVQAPGWMTFHTRL